MAQEENNNVKCFYKIRTLDDVPDVYKTHPNFDKLIKDPAHGNKMVPGALREAMAAIEAERQGLVKALVSRNSNGYIDFIDGDGRPYDVKTPPSPFPIGKFPFNEYAAGNAVLTELDTSEPNDITGKKEPVNVLLDVSYLTKDDYLKLKTFLDENTNSEQKKRIVEVKIDFDNLEHNKVNSVVLDKLKRAGR
ncbi:MAG: hypothetical protein AB7U85_06780 [Alphaproteobacteria bacterium]